MSFPQYKTTKDTSDLRLGLVPSHWDIPKLKHLARIRNGRDYKDVEIPLGGFPVIGSGGEFARASQFLYEGESVLLGRKGTIDKPLHINGRFWTVDTMFYTEIKRRTYGRFLYYVALTFPFSMYSTNTALPSMAQEDLANLSVPIPDIGEQEQVAAFLDHETAKIDALVEEQKRLIRLLKEKRQAVISQAVTKGLDPNLPMKDSGVEWLGEVPAHWRVGSLRWYASIQGGIAKGKTYENEETVELPYLRVANVQDGHLDLNEVKTVELSTREISRYLLQPGDVLMNEGGDNDKLGRGAVWQGEIDPCLHQNHVFAIRPTARLLSSWLSLFTQSDSAKTHFYLYSKQSTNLASISASNIMSCRVPIPPVDEQRILLEDIVQRCQQLATMQKEAQRGIDLLQERRSALISAAVTGKIDVCNWQAPQPSTTEEQPTERKAAS